MHSGPFRVKNAPTVCVPKGVFPVMHKGQEVQTWAINVNVGAQTADGSRRQALPVREAQATPAVDGQGSGSRIRGATLGQRLGVWTCSAACLWEGLGAFRAATITTRECAYFTGPYPRDEEVCVAGTPIAGAKGEIEVHDNGSIDVSGGRVNLGDQYQLAVVARLLRVRDGGRARCRPRRPSGVASALADLRQEPELCVSRGSRTSWRGETVSASTRSVPSSPQAGSSREHLGPASAWSAEPTAS